MKRICFIACLCGVIGLSAFALMYRPLVFAQGITQDPTKETPELKKKPSPGFEDDQNPQCITATQEAKLVASIVESYSRRLGTCSISNPNFRNDCSLEFRRVVQSYNQYQLAVSRVRNHCS